MILRSGGLKLFIQLGLRRCKAPDVAGAFGGLLWAGSIVAGSGKLNRQIVGRKSGLESLAYGEFSRKRA